MPRAPKLITFVGNDAEVKAAITGGCDALILEDSKVSIRSYHDDFGRSNFGKLGELAALARRLNPLVELPVNVDLLAHQHQFDLLSQLIEECQRYELVKFRVQDPGLALFFKAKYPKARLHLNVETGNQNGQSIDAFFHFFESQTLSNELTHLELEGLNQVKTGHYELQVHGPILIQYSSRRFLAGMKSERGETMVNQPTDAILIRRLAQDTEYPGRYFPFYDNPHGHFMYLYFDRTLIRYLKQLVPLDIDYWLIDGRGEAIEYLTDAITAFKSEIQRYFNAPAPELLPETFEQLQKSSRRPLKAGFFLANKTDSDRKIGQRMLQEAQDFVGTVVDVIRGKWMTIDVEQPISAPNMYKLLTPDGKTISLKVNEFYSLNDERILTSQGHRFIKTHWKKGACSKSILLATRSFGYGA